MNYLSRRKIFAVPLLLLALCVAFLVPRGASSKRLEPQDKPATSTSNYRLSGPYTHKNLTIFLVHGKELMPGKTFLRFRKLSPGKR
jgi:hypothetical protein